MAAAKAGRWGEAVRRALSRPHAWALISRPLRQRLSQIFRARQARPLDLPAKEGA
jgi:hypothetical protein